MTERVETRLVAGGRAQGAGAPLGSTIVVSSTYRLGGELEYGRDGNEAWRALEDLVGELEGGHGVAFGSGLAACAAVLDALPPGGTIVAPRSAYHGFTEQLRVREAAGRLRVRRIADIADAGEVAAALPGADMVWLETPSNPLIAIADIAAAAAAREPGCLLGGRRHVRDATAAAAARARSRHRRPQRHEVHRRPRRPAARHRGVPRPRRRRSGSPRCASARARSRARSRRSWPCAACARSRCGSSARRPTRASSPVRLDRHPAVTRVRYPGLPDDPGHALAARQMSGFGAMLAFETSGGAAAADAVCARLRVISAATSLGGVETLIERRARYESERRAGTPETLLRLSVGIEHVEDLWADLDQALAAASS